MQGTKVSQDSIFDIKTRSENSSFDMDEILPRLWVNQTPNFLLAYHRYGLFKKPEVKDARQEVQAWHKVNAPLLGRLHALVKRIVDTLRDLDNAQLEVSWDGQGPLRITKQIGEGKRVLPAELCNYWENL